jgi:hypothetical protein
LSALEDKSPEFIPYNQRTSASLAKETAAMNVVWWVIVLFSHQPACVGATGVIHIQFVLFLPALWLLNHCFKNVIHFQDRLWAIGATLLSMPGLGYMALCQIGWWASFLELYTSRD